MESVPYCSAPASQINIRFAIEVSDLFSINIRNLPVSSHRGCGLSETGSAFMQKEKGQGTPSLQLVEASEGKARTYIQRMEIQIHTNSCMPGEGKQYLSPLNVHAKKGCQYLICPGCENKMSASFLVSIVHLCWVQIQNFCSCLQKAFLDRTNQMG